MTDFAADPIVNVVHRGIKEPIRLLLDSNYFTAALILMYSAIDTMAHLSCPPGKTKERKKNFIAWCEKYIQLPGQDQLTGLELFGARCGLLHTHSATSDLSIKGQVREMSYADKLTPPIKYVPSVAPDQVIVSATALIEAFLSGIDRYLIDIYKDPEMGKLADQRFQNILHRFPYKTVSQPVA
jgi:hypothetical protein